MLRRPSSFPLCRNSYSFLLMESSRMEHRSFISRSQMSETENEQMPNCQTSDPRLNLGAGSMMMPSENLAAREFIPLSYGTTSLPTPSLPFPNNGSEIQSYLPDYSRTMHDPYMHSLSASNSARVQPYYAPLGPCYNQVGVGVNATTNPQLEYGRASHKRKFPSAPEVNMGGCYGAGSSSNSSISAEHFHTKPMHWPHDYENYIMPTQEERSERNVRSRHGSTLHLETVQPMVHSVVPQDFHSVAGTSEPTLLAQWSHNPASFDSHSLANSSAVETSSLNREGDHSNIVSYVHNANMVVGGNNHPNMIPDRAFPLLPTHNGPPLAGGLMTARSSYNQRSAFRAIPSYPSPGIAANLEDARFPRFEISMPPRYSRPVSIAPRSTDRNGRARTRYDRYQPFSDNGTHVRWVSSGVTMMERASFYDPRNWYDQHREMRLDIDNMSYEQLLALEETIGYVSTGLSEDVISRCLMETTYCSSGGGGTQEEKCAICLEEYHDKDGLGTMKCKHGFHFSCIRQWLLIKNVCPICKVAASDDVVLNEE